MRCKQEFDRLVIKNGWGTIVSFVFITLFFSFSVVLILTDGLTQKLSQPKSLGELGLVFFSLLIAFFGAWGLNLTPSVMRATSTVYGGMVGE